MLFLCFKSELSTLAVFISLVTPGILFMTYRIGIIMRFQFCFHLQIPFQISEVQRLKKEKANKKSKIIPALYDFKVASYFWGSDMLMSTRHVFQNYTETKSVSETKITSYWPGSTHTSCEYKARQTDINQNTSILFLPEEKDLGITLLLQMKRMKR